MHVTVAGVVTSIEAIIKNEKEVTNVLLSQGKKQQIAIRFEGHEYAELIELYQPITVTGNVMMWSTRNGADAMLMAENLA